MEQPFSKKKTKFRKMINRAKNRFQRFKKIFKRHVVPVVLSAAVLSAVLFGSAYRAYATGMEEFFYYTYFDLISGLFAETGQQFSLKDEFYTNPDRVSRSEEHTSELQSRLHLVCRLLLEKKHEPFV